jgi:hypothetical protein
MLLSHGRSGSDDISDISDFACPRAGFFLNEEYLLTMHFYQF